jgi:bifunctional DNA-binding transcriptional regulator/antitoxin component of YhaV-PrlF toxin-antitoxin module
VDEDDLKRLGHNKLNSKGQCRIPDKVLDVLGAELGSDHLGFRDCEEDGVVKVKVAEVNF